MPSINDIVVTSLLTYGVHSFIACGLALVAARVVRRPQDRDLVWKAAIFAPLATATIAVALSLFAGHGLFVDLAEVARRVSPNDLPGREVVIRVSRMGARSSVDRQYTDPVTRTLSTIAITLALGASGVGLLRLTYRRRRLSRAVAKRREIGKLVSQSGTPVRLTTAAALQSPVAFGASEICLPRDVVTMFSAAHQRSLIAHEVAHLERRDPAWFFAVELIAALSAFQPLMGTVIRAFRRDVELICDEAAVRETNDQASLIGALALLASPFDPRSPLQAAATAYDGSPLVARAQRIAILRLSAAPVRTRPRLAVAVAAFAALLCATPVFSAAPRLTDLPLHPEAAMPRDAIDSEQLFTIDKVVTRTARRSMTAVR